MLEQVNLSFSNPRNASYLSQVDVGKVENALLRKIFVDVIATKTAHPDVLHSFIENSI